MSDKSEPFSEAYNPSVSFADSPLYKGSRGCGKVDFSLYTRLPTVRRNFFSFFTRSPGLSKKQIFVFL